ncbi:unnamed protein product [Chrysoparadoxa australica]
MHAAGAGGPADDADAMLSRMSQAEIQAAQAELESMLSPQLVAKIRAKGSKSSEVADMSEQTNNGAGGGDLTTAKAKHVQDLSSIASLDALERAVAELPLEERIKLGWTNAAEINSGAAEGEIGESDLRLGLDGETINLKKGEAEAAGYTASQLVDLARSSVPGQCILGLRALRGIMRCRRRHIMCNKPPNPKHLPRMLPLVVVMSLSHKNSLVVPYAVEALSCYLCIGHSTATAGISLGDSENTAKGGMRSRSWLNHQSTCHQVRPLSTPDEDARAPSRGALDQLEQQEGQDLSVKDLTDLGYVDPVVCLLKLSVLQGLASALGRCQTHGDGENVNADGKQMLTSRVAVMCLQCIASIIQRGIPAANHVIASSHLLAVICEKCLQPDHEEQSPQAEVALEAVRVIRLLCESSRHAAQTLTLSRAPSDSPMLSHLKRLLLTEGPLIQSQVLDVWRACLCYGVEIDEAEMILLSLLQQATATATATGDSVGSGNSNRISGGNGQWLPLFPLRSKEPSSQGNRPGLHKEVLVSLCKCMVELSSVCIIPKACADGSKLRGVVISRAGAAALSDRVDSISAAAASSLESSMGCGSSRDLELETALINLVASAVKTRMQRIGRSGKTGDSASAHVTASITILTAMIKVLEYQVEALTRQQSLGESAITEMEWLSALFRLLLACFDFGQAANQVRALIEGSSASILAALTQMCQSLQVLPEAHVKAMNAHHKRSMTIMHFLACQVVNDILSGVEIKKGLLAAYPFLVVPLCGRGDEMIARRLIKWNTTGIAQTVFTNVLCDERAHHHSCCLLEGRWYELESLCLDPFGAFEAAEGAPTPLESLLPLPRHWLLLPLAGQGGQEASTKVVGATLQLLLEMEAAGNSYLRPPSLTPEIKLYYLLNVCHYNDALNDEAVSAQFEQLMERVVTQCHEAGEGFETRLMDTISAMNSKTVSPGVILLPNDVPQDEDEREKERRAVEFVSDVAGGYLSYSYGNRSFSRAVRLLMRAAMPVTVRALLWSEIGKVGLLHLLSEGVAFEDIAEGYLLPYDNHPAILDAYITAMKHKRFCSDTKEAMCMVACHHLSHYFFAAATIDEDGDKDRCLDWAHRQRFAHLTECGHLAVAAVMRYEEVGVELSLKVLGQRKTRAAALLKGMEYDAKEMKKALEALSLHAT